jgi:hypothetical protein
MDFSLKDLRAFAVRNRVDVTFHVRATDAAWMVNRRGLVARPSIGDSTLAGVEETLEAADAFIVEEGKEPCQQLTREQFIELMAARTAAASTDRRQGDE